MAELPERRLADEAAMARFGEDIAAALKPGDVVHLSGELGAGKTTIARAVIRALCGDRELDVPSPSYTLVQNYQGRFDIRHVDLYRLASPDEIDELGLDETGGVVLVEWPEHGAPRLAAPTLLIQIGEAGAGRVATISGPGAERLARSLQIRDFLGQAGWGAARRAFLLGDASTRAYETATLPGQPVRIVMNAPRRPDGPPIRDGLPYSRIAHLAETVVPFVAIDHALRAAGFSAPEIHAADIDAGLLLIEHLGHETMVAADGSPIAERYCAAAALLAQLHGKPWASRIDFPGGNYDLPAYDRGAMGIETELLLDWYYEHVSGRVPDAAARRAFGAAWSRLFDRLEGAEKSLVLRDFHSPNIIWRDERSDDDRIGLIDFQDALIGPAAYDVASLAQDARVTIAGDLEGRIVEAYAAARAKTGPFDRAGFEEAYAIMSAQRNSKILGIFVRLNIRDGKPHYLRHLPRVRAYLARALAHPALAELRTVYFEAGILNAEPA